jgi:hypothetical protein
VPAVNRLLPAQTNVIAAVEEGDERIEDVHDWLEAELAPLVPDAAATFLFGGAIHYFEKS